MILRLNSDCATPTQCLDYFLPPVNDVWGKVLFSQVFLCPQGGGGLYLGGGGLHTGRRGSASREKRGLHLGGGVCIWEGGRHPPPKLEKQAVRIILECFFSVCFFFALIHFKQLFHLLLVVLVNSYFTVIQPELHTTSFWRPVEIMFHRHSIGQPSQYKI